MLGSDALKDARIVGANPRFVLYVEGPRDREILHLWARRVSSRLVKVLEVSSVILGGRQPARALEHFRALGGEDSAVRAICLLDRDGHGESSLSSQASEPGLEFFTWPRRHIESYLLVRAAISRCLRATENEWLVAQLLDEHIPEPDDEQALRTVDAKRLLSPNGPIAQAVGRPLHASRIARTMREGELHEDVLRLFDLLRSRLGLAEPLRYEVARYPER